MQMMLKQGTNTAHIQVVSTSQSDGSPTVAVPAMKGVKVLVKDAVFTINWKGEIVLKMDPFSELVADDNPTIESFDQKRSFPLEWAGLRNEELSAITGVPSVFCHKNRFIAVFETRHAVITAMQRFNLLT